MPIQIEEEEEEDGQSVAVRVTGKLVEADYACLVPELERLIQQHGKLRLLFELSGFQGWDAGALWDEIKFDMKHFADIERLAVIGDKKWEHAMTAFCKPFTKASIRYFDSAEAADARKWWRESERPLTTTT
jgi:hypothetical protein